MANPLIKSLVPMIRPYLTDETLSRVFDALVDDYQPTDFSEPIVVIKRDGAGVVCGGLYILNKDDGQLLDLKKSMPLRDILLQVINNL